MNHQAIEFLARERISDYTREAANLRLAQGDRANAKASRLSLPLLVGGRLRAALGSRAKALVSNARTLVARAG